MATLFDLTGEALQLQRQINESAELLFSDDPDEVAAATAELEALIALNLATAGPSTPRPMLGAG